MCHVRSWWLAGCTAFSFLYCVFLKMVCTVCCKFVGYYGFCLLFWQRKGILLTMLKFSRTDIQRGFIADVSWSAEICVVVDWLQYGFSFNIIAYWFQDLSLKKPHIIMSCMKPPLVQLSARVVEIWHHITSGKTCRCLHGTILAVLMNMLARLTLTVLL